MAIFKRYYFVSGLTRPKKHYVDDNSVVSNSDSFIESMLIDHGPYFDKGASNNVTALVGKTTHLNCRIRSLGNRTVSLHL